MLPFWWQFYAEISVAESWMDEKMPILSSAEYGKDEDGVQVCGILGCINLCISCVKPFYHIYKVFISKHKSWTD